VVLALHARVFVDRHVYECTVPASWNAGSHRRSRAGSCGSNHWRRSTRTTCGRRRATRGSGGGCRSSATDARGMAGLDGRRRRPGRCGLDVASRRCSSRAGRPSGRRLLALRPEHRSLEIGWTWLAPRPGARAPTPGCPAAPVRLRCPRLPPRRVQDRCTQRGAPRAGRLPSHFEGIHRKHMLVRDGEAAIPPGTASPTTSGRRSTRRPARLDHAEASKNTRLYRLAMATRVAFRTRPCEATCVAARDRGRPC
jgi:hypothetical protein